MNPDGMLQTSWDSTQQDRLRPPSLKEPQSADEEFWAETFRLVNEDPATWTMESAISEVLEVKNLSSIHMMQSPRTTKGKGSGKGKFFNSQGQR